ncbi:unnamed protein product [Linum trigynum]|uniref:TIR domain-containing protein n=2 Tax=Linum trigynum TaxID=586398 RepID=A0AAV2GK56_9ROSI
MAPSSSSALVASSSHSAMHTGEWDYDVFLCFRGDDTRHGFTSHLLAALSDRKIKVFIDTMLRKTESIDELLSVLQRSALSIVIFSENFADSTWCLDEVATIAQSMAKLGHRALPVFYKVGWSDVAEDSGNYSVTIHEKLKSSPEDDKRWRGALKTVANCAGHTSQAIQIESKLIKLMVEDVMKLLTDMSPSIKSNNLVGLGSRVWEVEQLLAMDSLDDTRIIGLWGMGGVGKTTLAKACYERMVSSTEEIKHHFIWNINENCERQRGVEGIVHELYSKLLSENNLGREDLDMNYRRARLSRLKVFIVLDAVETHCQLEQFLLGDVFNLTKLFATGSRIIVTTRNKKVLQNAMAKVYGIECLNDDESIQLFSLRAFRQYCPPDNWMHLSRIATSKCKGNPLALRVLGGTLFGEDKDYWESFLGGLSLIQNPQIRDILRRSYDKMGTDEKRLFLDVACFLHGISRSTVIGYLAVLYPAAHVKVKDLIDNSLLICRCSEYGEKIEIHDLLKTMALDIVNEEPKLGKRSRLVDPDDIYKLLTTTKVESWGTLYRELFFRGIEMMVPPRRKRRKVIDMDRKGKCALEGLITTEGINLNLSKAKEMHLEANAFQGMDSLTFLKFWRLLKYIYHYQPTKKIIHLPSGGIDSLPDRLRWLQWDEYPSKSLPSGIYPQYLVHLIIRWSPIENCWENFDQPKLVNLVVLDLSSCFNLTAIPDLSESSKLEELLLPECRSLVELPSHVQCLEKLIILDLGYCLNLERLPSKLNSKFLKFVRMHDCPKVKFCPEINSGDLMELDLNGTPVSELPNAIYHVKEGGSLHLYGEIFTNFPAISASLDMFWLCHTAMKEINSYDHQASFELPPKISNLRLCGNSQLKSLPKSIWSMAASSLTVMGSPLLESLPEISEPVNGLKLLYITECESLKCLPLSINNLVSLSDLRLGNTGIKSLPSSIEELERLCHLDLSNCKSLESIPSNFHNLPKLLELLLRGCSSIQYLPELPPNLSILDVSGCRLLQALPSNITKLSWKCLRFYDCPQIDRILPDEIMANYLVHAILSRHSKNELAYSGSDIPEWFEYKNVTDKDNSCLTVQLPPANCTGSKQPIKGIAFGVVWSSDAFDFWPIMKCECDFGTITMASWSSYSFSANTRDVTKSSDQVLLWFDKIKQSKEGETEAWFVKYASQTVLLRFSPDLRYTEGEKQTKNLTIKRYGVSPLY